MFFSARTRGAAGPGGRRAGGDSGDRCRSSQPGAFEAAWRDAARCALPRWLRLRRELWPNPSGVNPLPPLLPQVVLKGDARRLNVHGVSGATAALGWRWG